MVVKILKIVQWAISRKPTKLHTLNFNKKKQKFSLKKERKKQQTKMKITNLPLFLKNKRILINLLF
jgi:hypothetical protein